MKFISTPGLITPKLPRIKFLVLPFQLCLVLYLVFSGTIVLDGLIVWKCYRALRTNYCKIFCCYRCQRPTRSATRLHLKKFQVWYSRRNYRVRYRQFTLSNMRFLVLHILSLINISFIRPHLDYGDAIFDQAYNKSFRES